MGTWQAPYAPAGAVQNKVTDAAGAEKMSLTAALGHACGIALQGRGAPGQASRIRLDEGYPARHARPRLDALHRAVAQAFMPVCARRRHQPVCAIRRRISALYVFILPGLRRRGDGSSAAMRAACSRSIRDAGTPYHAREASSAP